MPHQLISQVQNSIEGRDKVIHSLYTDASVRRAVVGTLVKLGCKEADAIDYFTDAIVSFVKSCYRTDFTIKSSITNYLIGAAKNIWLKAVTKSRREGTTLGYEIEGSDPPIEDGLINAERKEILRKLLDQLDETCKKVLTLWSLNKKMKEIAKILGYKSEGMARKKKHHCMRKLYEIVDSNVQIRNELSVQ